MYEQLSIPLNKLPWDTAKVVGGGGPKGTEPTGTDLPLGSNVKGTCLEGTDLPSSFSGALLAPSVDLIDSEINREYS